MLRVVSLSLLLAVAVQANTYYPGYSDYGHGGYAPVVYGGYDSGYGHSYGGYSAGYGGYAHGTGWMSRYSAPGYGGYSGGYAPAYGGYAPAYGGYAPAVHHGGYASGYAPVVEHSVHKRSTDYAPHHVQPAYSSYAPGYSSYAPVYSGYGGYSHLVHSGYGGSNKYFNAPGSPTGWLLSGNYYRNFVYPNVGYH